MLAGIFSFRTLALVLLVALPFAAFWASYRLTDIYFQTKIVPYPLEPVGRLIGAGVALWVAGLILPLVKRLIRR